MSAAVGPQIFTITRDKLVSMMEANFASLEKAVADIDEAIAVEDEKNTKASLERWRAKFVVDAIETKIMIEHLDDTTVHQLTGTQLIGIYRSFREVAVNTRFLRLTPPPSDAERPEHRLANTAAAIPRSHMPEDTVQRIWTPGTPGGELAR